MRQSQFGQEGHAGTLLNHAHEGLDAAQRINALTVGCAFEVTELDELIAETVTLVQKPKHFVGKVSGANAGMRVEAVALCNVGKELFKIEGSHRQFLNGVGSDPDGSI